jgi:hypothetical protein
MAYQQQKQVQRYHPQFEHFVEETVQASPTDLGNTALTAAIISEIDELLAEPADGEPVCWPSK